MLRKSLIFGAVAMTALYSVSAIAAECKPSKWGADDEIGGANYVTPQRTLAAVKLVKKGESHPLGIVIDASTPAFPPRSLSLQVVQPGQQGGHRLSQFGYKASYNDDLIQTWLGIGPQIDGLGHLGVDGVYYNCLNEKDFANVSGLTKLGLEKVPPLISRGVLINLAKHLGVETMEAGQAVGSAEIKAAAKAQGVEIREGDVVLFHTGWTDGKLASDPKAWGSGEPGVNNEGMAYLAGLDLMAVGADTWGVEPVPWPKGDGGFYGHVSLLKEKGTFILETMNTGRLAKEGVNEFMFVLGHARIKGTVQMIINPVAMW